MASLLVVYRNEVLDVRLLNSTSIRGYRERASRITYGVSLSVYLSIYLSISAIGTQTNSSTLLRDEGRGRKIFKTT